MLGACMLGACLLGARLLGAGVLGAQRLVRPGRREHRQRAARRVHHLHGLPSVGYMESTTCFTVTGYVSNTKHS